MPLFWGSGSESKYSDTIFEDWQTFDSDTNLKLLN